MIDRRPHHGMLDPAAAQYRYDLFIRDRRRAPVEAAAERSADRIAPNPVPVSPFVLLSVVWGATALLLCADLALRVFA